VLRKKPPPSERTRQNRKGTFRSPITSNQGMRIITASLVAAAVLLAGCTDDTNRPAASADRVESPTPHEKEQSFHLLIHCGLSYPLRFDGRSWLPVDKKLRRTHNPPEGFGGDENYDRGTIRVVDQDTLIYRSSTGVEVEYEPTERAAGGCR